jgi:hypothetical protein
MTIGKTAPVRAPARRKATMAKIKALPDHIRAYDQSMHSARWSGIKNIKRVLVVGPKVHLGSSSFLYGHLDEVDGS